MIDTHAHLTDERLASRIDEVLARAGEAGVERIIIPATDLSNSKQVVELAKKYDNVYGLVGIHPEEITNHKSQITNFREELEKLVYSSNKIVGIGEIGLEDYSKTQKLKNSKTQDNMELQKIIFKGQLDLGVKLNLPVVIHMRDAEDEMREIIKKKKNLPRGQFHCFAGSDEFLKLVLEKGFYVSFCGNITYASAGRLREQVRKVPLKRLLLETDSPYLAPERVPSDSLSSRADGRGSLNEPANVKIIAEYIAKLLDIPPDTLINQTTANAKWLFFGG